MITVSLCMIVKNEGKILDRCLQSISDLVDEIIIVDTGSNDDTKNIARKYTDLVYDYEWKDDFADARNFAFSKATKEYIYTADADEVLDEVNRRKFKELKEVLLPEIEIVQMIYLTDMRYNTTENYKRDYRPKLYKRLRNFTWINPIHETVRLEPVVYDSDIEILHMPTSNHSERDLSMFRNIIEKNGELNNKLHMMYAREVYKCGTKEDLIAAKEFFEKTLSKPVMTKEDYTRAHEAIAVLAKIYEGIKDNIGIVSLIKYCLGELSYIDTRKEMEDMLADNVSLLDAVKYVENSVKYNKEWNNQLSSELCLHVGIGLMKEKAYEESRKWLVRTIHKTICVIDLDSSKALPSKYLEEIDNQIYMMA